MKYGMADELFPATSEGGKAVEEFIKICPPTDRANLDREWMEMCGLFVQGWLAHAAQQSVQADGAYCPHCGDLLSDHFINERGEGWCEPPRR